jgi:hypothetical protein
MRQAMDNLSNINVGNNQTMKIYDFSLCDSISQPKVLF